MENHRLLKTILKYHANSDMPIEVFESLVNDDIAYYFDNFEPGSKEMCLCARCIKILHDETPYQVTRELANRFITCNNILGVGDYFEYLYFYIKTFGNSQIIWECGDVLFQHHIFNLAPEHKKMLENELKELQKQHVCERVLHRITASTQAVNDQYIPYKTLEHNGYKRNYRYYPF